MAVAITRRGDTYRWRVPSPCAEQDAGRSIFATADLLPAGAQLIAALGIGQIVAPEPGRGMVHQWA